MQIKTMDGMEYHVGSQAQSNTNTVLGRSK